MSHPLEPLFKPCSIAVIGASRQKDSIGHTLLRNLLSYEFSGVVYPVNPRAEYVHSIRCYPSVLDVPDEVDMAIIVVPRRFVPGVMEECGKKGVKVAVIISAGFKEVGGEGFELERRVVDIARKYGIRVVGPNCMGVINMGDGVSMNATFAPTKIRRGKMGFVSQSGALGVAILEYISELNLGISKFVSIGNRADVSVAEIVDYLGDDPDTEVILLYMEGFGDLSEFIPAVRKAVKKKPVIAVKSGRTQAGARAASSHTGALAGSDEFAEALFRQTGIIRAYSVEELFDMAIAFSFQPPPMGKRMAVVTNGGGPGILTADAIAANGLEMAELSEETKNELRRVLPDVASVGNPVDMIASATEESYDVALRVVARDPGVDGIIVIYVTPINRDPLVIARVVADVSTETQKPILGVFMGRKQIFDAIHSMKVRERVPAFMFPESAARAMKALYDFSKYREKVFNPPPVFDDVNLGRIREIVESSVRGKGGGWLGPVDVAEVLDALRVPQPEWRFIPSDLPDPPAGLLGGIRFPVAVKAVAEGVVHKSDVGGVALGVQDLEDVAGKMEEMKKRYAEMGYTVEGFFVQEMAESGKEVIIGAKRYPMGPLLMFGLGGVFVEILKDVSFGVYPLSEVDANEMITSIKGYPILVGARGEKGVDVNALRNVLLRISYLVGNVKEIEELDLNPVIAREKGCAVVDARIKVSDIRPDSSFNDAERSESGDET